MTDADLILCELLVLRCQRRDPRAADELVTFFFYFFFFYLLRMVLFVVVFFYLVLVSCVYVFRRAP